MGDVGGVWRLLRGGEAVGAVEVDEVDFPWLRGMFVAEPGFEGVRPWFEEALAAIEGEEFERFEAVYDRIEGELTLVAPDGRPVSFLLHVAGERAWFRWDDEAAGPA